MESAGWYLGDRARAIHAPTHGGRPSLLRMPASVYPAASSNRLQMATRSSHPPPRSFEESINTALRNHSGEVSSSPSMGVAETVFKLEGWDVEVEARIRLLRLWPRLSLAPSLLAPSSSAPPSLAPSPLAWSLLASSSLAPLLSAPLLLVPLLLSSLRRFREL